MAEIYAISDIHGYLEPLEEVLSLVDLSKRYSKNINENHLIS